MKTTPNPLPKMLRPIPGQGNKARWKAIDDCIFFLTIEGIITESEVKKAKDRLIKRCYMEGIHLSPKGKEGLVWHK